MASKEGSGAQGPGQGEIPGRRQGYVNALPPRGYPSMGINRDAPGDPGRMRPMAGGVGVPPSSTGAANMMNLLHGAGADTTSLLRQGPPEGNGLYHHRMQQQQQHQSGVEAKLHQYLAEMKMMQETVYQLQYMHEQMKQKYETENRLLRRQLMSVGSLDMRGAGQSMQKSADPYLSQHLPPGTAAVSDLRAAGSSPALGGGIPPSSAFGPPSSSAPAGRSDRLPDPPTNVPQLQINSLVSADRADGSHGA
eukprot:CAMPEP_0119128786 /NCGR_PEP_ID=MMETSP1310-20130426/6799_1 /TAXON_ID=464262 /ORGANISM="Genus nov. species nov., Strain RCC2339" /LENGTH=249 /DNA_ID=CAMNT_0007119157 /DNA_START=132 /DNA_END=877 /DNA_ORIENTATION=-